MRAYSRRYTALATLVAALLAWQAPATAASRRDAPVVMGPDAKHITGKPAAGSDAAGDPAADRGGHGPLVVYVGTPPHPRGSHGKISHHSGRHSRQRFADSSR